MRWPVKIALAVALVVLAGLISWQLMAVREPVYQGKPLSFWLEYGDIGEGEHDSKAAERGVFAVRSIGTNALPVLVKMVHAKESPFGRKIRLLVNLYLARPVNGTAEEFHEMANFGFSALGATVESAVHALINALSDTDDDVRLCAIDCLGSVGPEAHAAVPALIRFIDNKDYWVQKRAIEALGRIHSDGSLVVPILITNLNQESTLKPLPKLE